MNQYMNKEDIHKRVSTAIEKVKIKPGFGNRTPTENIHADVLKCAIIPYKVYKDKETGEKKIKYCLYKPLPKDKTLLPPQWQLSKGTREIYDKIRQEWINYEGPEQLKTLKKKNLEPLLKTAAREGLEELGLPPEDIKKAYDFGVKTYTSATKETEKELYVFAVEVPEHMELEKAVEQGTKTDKCKFIKPKNFKNYDIREDQKAILTAVDVHLRDKLNIQQRKFSP